jgi:hypothetical protein
MAEEAVTGMLCPRPVARCRPGHRQARGARHRATMHIDRKLIAVDRLHAREPGHLDKVQGRRRHLSEGPQGSLWCVATGALVVPIPAAVV